jgi:hypothetical protein
MKKTLKALYRKRKNFKCKVSRKPKARKSSFGRKKSRFGTMSKAEVKKEIVKEVYSFVKDVKSKVLTKSNVSDFFKILFPDKYIQLIKKKQFKELLKSKKEILTDIKASFKQSAQGESPVGKFFTDKMKPILYEHFNKFADQADVLQTELCSVMSSVLSTAIMEFLMVAFAETGPFDAVVPLLRIKTIPDLVKKTCSKMTDNLITQLKAQADKKLSFGRTRKNVIGIFKCAAKKCKGGRNYRTCMKKTLKALYRKRKNFKCTVSRKPKARKSSFGSTCTNPGLTKPSLAFGKRKIIKRKSPKAHAGSFNVGTKKKGLDKKTWIVKKTSSGVKRWVRVTKKK